GGQPRRRDAQSALPAFDRAAAGDQWLYTNYGMSSAVAVLYGLHLTAIAGLNAWLWWTILGGWRRETLASLFPLLVFIPGTIVAAFAPHLAPFVWFIAFGGLVIQRFTIARPKPDA